MDTLQDFIEKIRHLDSIGCTNLATWLIENTSFRDGEIASATDEQLERARLDDALIKALDRFGRIAR